MITSDWARGGEDPIKVGVKVWWRHRLHWQIHCGYNWRRDHFKIEWRLWSEMLNTQCMEQVVGMEKKMPTVNGASCGYGSLTVHAIGGGIEYRGCDGTRFSISFAIGLVIWHYDFLLWLSSCQLLWSTVLILKVLTLEITDIVLHEILSVNECQKVAMRCIFTLGILCKWYQVKSIEANQALQLLKKKRLLDKEKRKLYHW